jgi:phosphatidate phosphatase APP1
MEIIRAQHPPWSHHNTLYAMKVPAIAAVVFALGAASAAPLDIPDALDTVLLFDAPAFETSSNTWTASQQAFVYLRQPAVAPLVTAFSAFLDTLGISVGDALSILESRLKLFAAIGLGSQEVSVTTSDCDGAVTAVGKTDSSGMVDREISLCSSNAATVVEVSDNITATVFPSATTGFGVISDIDDTIKNTNVLDTASALQKTFLEEAVAIDGMPELYTQLDADSFIYLSGSPFQLQPMLKEFISTAGFPLGPLLLKNLTFTSVDSLKDFLAGDGTEVYKKAQVERIHEWYPRKTWLGVGDSTQSDPEVYGDA